MKVKIQRWGNSLALRIPKPFAEDAQVQEGTIVDLSVQEGRLVVAPVRRRTGAFTLKRLLEGVEKQNLHGESSFGAALGREVW